MATTAAGSLHALSERTIVAIRAELVAEHGGSAGLPWEEGLRGAVARAGHVQAIRGPRSSPAHLAAACAYALVRDRCFPDGNEAIALAVVDVFLQQHGLELTATEAEAAETMLTLAAGELTEGALAEWIAARSVPL